MPAVASLYVALSLLLLLALGFRVVQRRRAAQIGLGDGGDAELQRRIRAHANAIENLPLALLGLLLLELGGLPAWALHALGAALLLSRVLHAAGLSQRSGVSFGRFWGMLGTWLVMLAIAALLLLQFVGLIA